MTLAPAVAKSSNEAEQTRIFSARTDDGPGQVVAASYWANYGSLVRVAVMLGCDRSDADDVVQDAFVRVYGRASRLGDLEAVNGYLRTMVVNLCRSRARRHAAWLRRLLRLVDAMSISKSAARAYVSRGIAAVTARLEGVDHE